MVVALIFQLAFSAVAITAFAIKYHFDKKGGKRNGN